MSSGSRYKLSEKGLLTPDNCVVALIDHQPQMLFGVSNFDRQSIINNTVALAKATQVFDVPVVLIAGGDGKGQDFAPLASAVRSHARGVVLIGRDADAIAMALAPTGVALDRAATMEDAVGRAFAMARPGDAVLLSPACASFDMFRNYGHRGDVFAQAARALGTGHSSTPDVPCPPRKA